MKKYYLLTIAIIAFSMLAQTQKLNAATTDESPTYGYTYEFDDSLDVSNPEFHPAGWKHIADPMLSFIIMSYIYMTYEWMPHGGLDNSGALRTCGQVIEDQVGSTAEVHDIIVTPAVTGTSRIYAKSNEEDDSYIEFYHITTDELGNISRGELISPRVVVSNMSNYTAINIPAVQGERIGLRCHNVDIDRFQAEQVDLVIPRKLYIKTVRNLSGVFQQCDTDNNYTLSYKVVVRNDGEVNINADDPDNKLSLYQFLEPNDTLVTVPVGQTLKPGQESDTITITTVQNYLENSYTGSYYIHEYVSGSNKYANYAQPQARIGEPYVSVDGSSLHDGSTVTITPADSTYRYISIRNNGGGDLTVTSLTTTGDFFVGISVPFTVKPHRERLINLSLTSFTAGTHTGTLAIKGDYIDITLNITATVSIADGITSVSVTSQPDNSPVYNLSGQRVGSSYHGIVISKGKKYIK